MQAWRSYELYEDRPSGSVERITLVDEHRALAYTPARDPGRLSGLRGLSLHDRERNERAQLRLKLFGPLSYQLVRGGGLQGSDWAGELAGRTIPPGDPDNPLKARWMGLFDGQGIHGTEQISSLGARASHGCIRMSIKDVKQLYGQVKEGTPVFVQ